MPDKTAETNSAPVVTSSEARAPITRPSNPAITEAMMGRNTIAAYTPSALHQVDVFHSDRAAVTEINDENRKSDGGFRSRHRQDEQREHLPHQVVQERGEGDEVNVHRQEEKLYRHQNHNDVLAVQEDAEHPDREEDGGDGQVVGQSDGHDQAPCP